MALGSDSKSYFTRHLFRTGLECPTRLYYRALDYPENQESLPFIAHYRYNKRQLKNLAKCSFPKGVQIDTLSTEGAAEKTEECLKENTITLFDPVFIWKHYKAKISILVRKANHVDIYYFQTRAFKPEKHDVSNSRGDIYAKWLDYLTDIAFQVHVMEKCYPDFDISPHLVVPSKYALAQSDALTKRLNSILKGDLSPEEVTADVEELLVRLEVKGEVDSIRSGSYFEGEFKGKSFEEVLQQLAGLYFSKNKYPVSIGRKCKNCEFRIEQSRVVQGERSGFQECWHEAVEDQLKGKPRKVVFDLIGPGTNRWVERGIYFQQQVPEGEFYDLEAIHKAEGRITEKQRQSLQILQARGSDIPEEIIKPKLFEELDRWQYPIHFLDFEAGNYVIPQRSERTPYHLLVFQYSCHTLYEDGSWTHTDWIDEPGGDYSNYQLIRKLKAIPDILSGTLVQYSNFERNALKTIRQELKQDWESVADASELYDWTGEIIRRNDSSSSSSPFLADLSRMVKSYYYNHYMQDSLSIKDVLQSVLTISPRLKELYSKPYSSSNFESMVWWQLAGKNEAQSPYRLMAESEQEVEGVRRGTEAMVVYAKLLSEDLSDTRREAYKKALLRYCEVDTLAMLMIYQHWNSLMQARN